ncbi:MAG: DMT family transporter [Leptothrix sp. (in: b-proteobacteria)]
MVVPVFWPAVLALMLNALVWGVSWWPFRQLQALGLHPLWTTALVYGLAVGVILLWRPAAFGQLLRSRALWGIAFAAGVTNAAFNWAVTIGEVVRVVLLFYLSPLWTVLLARWLLHERFSGRVALRVLLALAGATLVLGVGGRTGAAGAPAGPALLLADLLGLLAGATFALNNVLLRRESQRPDEGRALAMFSGGVLVSSAVALSAGTHAGVPISWPASVQLTWLLPALLLGLAFLGGNLALQYGATRLPANVTAVVMPTEIVFASVSAVWLGGEQLQPAVLAGGALILAATVLAARGEG